MTREEKISKAAYSQYCNSESICFTLMCDSFKQGAKWADEHPKSPWISVDEDLPCNHEELIDGNITHSVLVRHKNGKYELTVMAHFVRWNFMFSDITHWMPIPKLPEE